MRLVDRKLKVQYRCDWKEAESGKRGKQNPTPAKPRSSVPKKELGKILESHSPPIESCPLRQNPDFSYIQLPFRDPPPFVHQALVLDIALWGRTFSLSPVAGYFQASQPLEMPTASRAKL